MNETTPETAPRPQAITLRAIGLGLIAVVFMEFLINYQGHVAINAPLTLSQFSEGALLVFVGVVALNSLVRLAWPRLALTAAELLTILAMTWSAGMLAGRGWTGRLIGMLCGPRYLASTENRWEAILGGFGRDGLLPTWLYPDFDSEAVNWFFSGAPPGQPIPWSAWISPLFWWCCVAVAFLAFAMAITALFYKQWSEHERLAFPLLSAPVMLVEETPGRRTGPIFRNRLFWIGILLTTGVYVWNMVGYFYQEWPTIGVYAPASAVSREVITGFPAVAFRVMPLVLGFMYFANLDLLLSLWVFFILGWIVAGISATTGWAVGSGTLTVTGIDIVHVHSSGALIFLAVWSVYVARRHLRRVWRAALSRDRAADNPGGAMPYRTALLVCLWSALFLVVFCRRIGMEWTVIALALGFNFIAFFTVAKYMAATGLSYINPSYTAGGRLIINMVGDAWMTPQSILGLGMIHGGQFGQMQRLWGFTMMPHAFKIAERAERGRSRILGALVLAVVVGAGFSLWQLLDLGYTRGGLRMEQYTFREAVELDFGYVTKAVSDVQAHKGLPADTEKLATWGLGFVLCGAVTLLHARFAWWPIHPVGLAFSSTSAGTYWFSIFLIWLFKLLILKIGGVKLYNRAKPVFVGFIAGYALALILSFSIDAIFFPGREGHAIHNW